MADAKGEAGSRYETLETRRENRILWVTLNRPERLDRKSVV